MFPGAERIREVAGADPRALPDDLLESTEPVVLRGVGAEWPVVRAALESPAAATAYLRRFYKDAAVVVMSGEPEIGGRFFYNDDLSGFNYKMYRTRLDGVLGELIRFAGDANPPSMYVGSTAIDTVLPGFRAQNAFNFGARAPVASIWVGNRTRIAAHHDMPDNLACVVAGHRRFTLFPPEQISNLYVGPLEFNPAGQPISLVDFARPDFQRFPRFAEAIKAARTAELGPGDAIVIPSMWWHHIESLDAFNVLVNYWWRQSPAYMDSPMGALMLSLMTVRDLPPAQRAAWENLFRHYVFEAGDQTAGHIPERARRALGSLDANLVRELRANVLARLHR
jgi:cupin-like protein